MFAGYGFSGKTLAAQELAVSVASGREVFGLFPCRRGKVLHIDYEQGSRMTFDRYQRLARARGTAPKELDGWLRVAIFPDLDLATAAAEDLLLRESEDHALVIIDSLTCAVPGVDENGREIAEPLYMLGRVSERTGATFIVIHHARKPQREAQGGAVMAIRGSSAIYGASGSVFVFLSAKGAPITVEHVRSPTDGVVIPNFGLVVEDVAMDGNPRAGVRIAPINFAAQPIPNEDKSTKGNKKKAADAAKAEARATRKTENEQETRDRDEADDNAAREIITGDPDGTTRAWVAALRKKRACGGERAHSAVIRGRPKAQSAVAVPAVPVVPTVPENDVSPERDVAFPERAPRVGGTGDFDVPPPPHSDAESADE